MHEFNGEYSAEHLNYVAFPLGGIGAGMICLEGTGAFSHVSVRNKPDIDNEPLMFAAVSVKTGDGDENVARVLEGQVPRHKCFNTGKAGNGLGDRSYGLPRFRHATFKARMPFAEIQLRDDVLPLTAKLTGWSPFVPTDADESSLPAAGLEYELTNASNSRVEGVFSFHSHNFLTTDEKTASVRTTNRSFILQQTGSETNPEHEAAFAIRCDEKDTAVNGTWFRGQWFDSQTMVWNHIKAADVIDQPAPTDGNPSPGGSIYVPFELEAGQSKTFRIQICWYAPNSDVHHGKDENECGEGCDCADTPQARQPTYQPWYAGQFDGIDALSEHWRASYDALRKDSQTFSDCFYDTNLPPEVVEAIAANLTILKSPTVLRDTDGRIWAWEGCCTDWGCCPGSCTHVWNYAQAMPHLFPTLEQTLRLTEFEKSQNEEGHQVFRSSLPIRPTADFSTHMAADGQLGGIMKVHRDWRISGNTQWLRNLWPRVRQSLDHCIEIWDPNHEGVLKEPHHNTYDIEFWGADGMCSSFYLGALRAAQFMGEALGEDISLYEELYGKGRAYVEEKLFNGEYFFQDVQWIGLRADMSQFIPLVRPGDQRSTEELALLEAEGPKYQYGNGCLSDGVLGAWIAEVCGVGEILDREKVLKHLQSIHRYNLKHDLTTHANPQRPAYAMGDDGGLLLCSWPNGGKPSLPFVYCDEVWTGFEYQVASHLMCMGCVEEGLDIVRIARQRFDGQSRNPFNEYECGHWYARAMSSYAMLYSLTGARYDAITKTLSITPKVDGDFRAFLSTATGFGTVGIRDGEPFIDVAYGVIDVQNIEHHK